MTLRGEGVLAAPQTTESASDASSGPLVPQRTPEPVPRAPLSGPSSRASLPPSRRIYREGDVIGGKYRLRYILGEGGMGMVWLARNDVLAVDVAIKFIRRDKSSPEATHRLLQEARAAARLDHPSIVRVLDFGESDLFDPYIVMEVLRGEQLNEAIERRKRFSPAAAVRTLLPIASALAAVHERKIVHRDLKPENIVLVKNDRGDVVPKIVDFGIARVWSETAGGDVTKAGTVLGSPDYMAPEQARGITDVDGQTDIWAFSVVLYEMLTGRRPFEGGNYQELVAQLLVRTPVPTTALGVDDAELWSIIERGLAKEREHRWPTIREMGAALARWALDRGIEDDVTGVSLAAHWLSESAQDRLSERPPAPASRLSRVATGRSTVRPQPPARRSPLVAVAVGLFALGGVAAVLFFGRARLSGDARIPEVVATPMAALPAPPPVTSAALPAVSPAPSAAQEPQASPASPDANATAAKLVSTPARGAVPAAKPSEPSLARPRPAARTEATAAPKQRRAGAPMPLPTQPNF